jgi:hypothetical protein
MAGGFVLAYVIFVATASAVAESRFHHGVSYVVDGVVGLLLIGAALLFFCRRGHSWPIWLLLVAILAAVIAQAAEGHWLAVGASFVALGCWVSGYRVRPKLRRGRS